jgi:hypothetical protein
MVACDYFGEVGCVLAESWGVASGRLAAILKRSCGVDGDLARSGMLNPFDAARVGSGSRCGSYRVLKVDRAGRDSDINMPRPTLPRRMRRPFGPKA